MRLSDTEDVHIADKKACFIMFLTYALTKNVHRQYSVTLLTHSTWKGEESRNYDFFHSDRPCVFGNMCACNTHNTHIFTTLQPGKRELRSL